MSSKNYVEEKFTGNCCCEIDPNCNTKSIGRCSCAEGEDSVAKGVASHAEGCNTISKGRCSHAEGEDTVANGKASHAEGQDTTTEGRGSHAEGFKSISSGDFSHAEGFSTKASELEAHAEGFATIASGIASHAEGSRSRSSGDFSHAEGVNTESSGAFSHSEGLNTVARGGASHAEGENTKAIGDASHSEGFETQSLELYSHAEGFRTIASNIGSHIMGQIGTTCENYAWHMAMNEKITAKISNDGSACFSGPVTAPQFFIGPGPCCDFAEMFETLDGNPIDVGYFVTLQDGKVRKATSNDEYILGIVSESPAILAGAQTSHWKDKYLRDKWNRIVYENIVVKAVKDEKKGVIVPEHVITQPMLNPKWDSEKKYIPRIERPEWVSIGLIGQILVRDDGTCEVNGYCKPNDHGVATNSSYGYKVIRRTDTDQIMILFR